MHTVLTHEILETRLQDAQRRLADPVPRRLAGARHERDP